MHKKISALAAIAIAAAVSTGIAAAGRAAGTQRVAITSPNGNTDTFVLTPLAPGPIKGDSGNASACCWSKHFIQRAGQSIEIDDPTRTFVGKHGTFTWRARIEWVDVSTSYSIGTGTWKIVRGTGAYAHLEGHGRVAIVTGSADESLADKAEGVLDLGG